MRIVAFSLRTAKEILRDPLNLLFGLGFPLVLLLLMSAIQANIPVELFAIEKLAPGIAIFGLSFMTLFSATLVAKDRESAFLQRLYTTPLTAVDFILGYLLPMLPIALTQGGLCYLAAICLRLPITVNILYALGLLLLTSLLFLSMGIVFGSVLGVKGVGGICGGLMTNLTAWLSGIWFDLQLVGGVFERIAHYLPFAHAVELQRAVIIGDFDSILPHLAWVLGYGVIFLALAIWLFLRQMKKI